MKLPPLQIGDLTVPVPFVLGGMGVKVSTSALAAPFADCGGVGTIAGVGLGNTAGDGAINFVKNSIEALIKDIRRARKLTRGVLAVNVMVALSNFEDLVRAAANEGIDLIVAGAGLAKNLPELAPNTLLGVIVSSGRAASLIIRTWWRRYRRHPDVIIAEGPLAGGHVGFKLIELKPACPKKLEKILTEVLAAIEEAETTIPVVPAGGIFDGHDIARFIKLGASGVQMATRFVATHECPVANAFKQLYIKSQPEDLTIIKSPVGLPGRVIRTKLVDRLEAGEKIPVRCLHQCLKTCNPKTAPYCIAQAMFNAAEGNLDEAIVFAGQNVHRIHEIVPVAELFQKLVTEAEEALNDTAS